MSAKELAITILGLVGTFCLPWPAEPGPDREGAQPLVRAASARCASPEAEARAGFVPVRADGLEAALSREPAHAARAWE